MQLTTGRVKFEAAAGDGPRKFKLHAYTGGLVNLPQYDIPVVFDLTSMRLQDNATQVPLLRNHDADRGVGHSEGMAIDVDSGVTGIGFLSVPGPDRDAIVEAADAGKEWQLSVGGTSTEEDIEYIPEGQSFRMNNRALQGPALAVSNYLLRETSFVDAGADADGAIATLLAAYHPQKVTKMNFEDWLASLGIKIDALTSDGLAKLRTQFNTEMSGDDESDESAGDESESDSDEDEASDDEVADSAGTAAANEAVAESIRQTAGETAAQEVERREELETLNATFGNPKHTVDGKKVSLLATALRKNWSADTFELNARRNARPQKMSSGRSDARNPANKVALLASMVFAVMGSASAKIDRDFSGCDSARSILNASLMAGPNNDIRQRAMEQSHDFRHHTLVELVASAMQLDGIDCSAAIRSDKWFKAAFSSNSVQDLFTQSTQAILLDTYMQHSATYDNFRSICDESDVPNFKTNERKSVSPNSGELERLEATGTASDAKLSATGEEFKISRFAKRWGIDDQDMINEDFGVFRTMPQFLGMSSARLLGKAVAKLLLTNPNMKDGNPWLSTAAGNLRTGSALTRANYIAACDQFEQQADGDVILELSPNVGFVPNKTLAVTFAELLSNSGRITGENATTTSENVLANDLDQIYRSALLAKGFKDPDDKSVTIAGSATSWYLFDTMYKAIELAHLQGSGRGPTIRTGTYENGRYGVWFDVKRDIGAAPVRRESVQKNNA